MNKRSINPDLVKLARQARGYSQSDLSTASGLTQGAISKLENGLLQLTEEAMEKLAAALRFPSSLFFEPDRIYGLPVSMQYRKKASVGQRSVEQIEAEVNLRLMHLRRLLASVDHDPEMGFPRLDIDDYAGDPEAVADMVRRMWLLPSGPLRHLTQVVERAGCIVFTCDFQSLGIDGLTLQPSGMPICIFLNSAMPGDRQRFTLAHEIGHAVMHSVPSTDMEAEADRFAAALLMPRRDIAADFAGGVTLGRLAALKPVWRVSMAALLVRAKTVGAINDSQSSYLWRQLSKAGYRTREPQDLSFSAEEATILPDILRLHQEELGYSVSELAKSLHLLEEDLALMHQVASRPEKPRLQIVR